MSFAATFALQLSFAFFFAGRPRHALISLSDLDRDTRHLRVKINLQIALRFFTYRNSKLFRVSYAEFKMIPVLFCKKTLFEEYSKNKTNTSILLVSYNNFLSTSQLLSKIMHLLKRLCCTVQQCFLWDTEAHHFSEAEGCNGEGGFRRQM